MADAPIATVTMPLENYDKLVGHRITAPSVDPALNYPPAIPTPNPWDQPRVSLMSKLMMRMQWGSFSSGDHNKYEQPFRFLAVHELGDEVLLFAVQQVGGYVVLTDQANMFPSDALMTQLRILEANAPAPWAPVHEP